MKKPDKKYRKIIIGLLIAVLILGSIIGILLFIKKMQSKPVNVYNIDYISTTAEYESASQTWGIVRAENIQNIYLSPTQRITEILVSEGDTVKKGQALLKYDTTLSDLQLEKQRIAVLRIENSLDKAKKELGDINRLKPYVPAKPTEPEREYEPHEIPEWLQGTGTKEDPMFYLVDEDTAFYHDFIDELFVRAAIEQSEIQDDPEEDPMEQDPVTEEPDTTDEPEPDPSEAPIIIPDDIYVCFEIHEDNVPEYTLIRNFGIHFSKNAISYTFDVFEPESCYSPLNDVPDIIINEGEQYTATEIAQMKKSAQERIKGLETDLKVAKLEERRIDMELSDGTIYAENDGTVVNLIGEDEALEENLPLFTVDGGGGYHVTGTLNELELSLVSVGDKVRVQDWMNGSEYEGTIISISDMPVESGSSWSSMNRNSSFYSFDVEIEKGAELIVDQSVDISYTPGGNSEGFYLENPFILKENGNSYVYIDDGGILRKCQIETGGSLWNSYTRVLHGLTRTEGTRIAFPYGPDVKEGARTRNAEIDELYRY